MGNGIRDKVFPIIFDATCTDSWTLLKNGRVLWDHKKSFNYIYYYLALLSKISKAFIYLTFLLLLSISPSFCLKKKVVVLRGTVKHKRELTQSINTNELGWKSAYCLDLVNYIFRSFMLRCPTAIGITELKFIILFQVIMMSHNNKEGTLPHVRDIMHPELVAVVGKAAIFSEWSNESFSILVAKQLDRKWPRDNDYERIN